MLSEKVKGIFREYSWPGNIRELRNLAEYFTFTGSPVITEEDLPPTFLYEREEVQEEPFVPPKAEPRRLFEWERAMEEKGILPEAYGFVLKMLYQWSKSREAGRAGAAFGARQERGRRPFPAGGADSFGRV